VEKWDIVHVNYTNILVFPCVWLLRKLRKQKPTGDTANRMEDQIPPAWLNALLRWIFVTMALWRMPLPFGVSLLLVARRK
jgi:hypothetical protein